ncbi:response regulator [Massilia sp. Dwa41.01b]|uniref:response regulator n=1 Tax=unclassified Massilia TaxID=2609279 RepID=UPI0015FF5F61|nr:MULTISPECIES: response regulator [unclassified Massilia]QNA90524.1 response regulator [Massilia sp. Dwa41.01b]QNA97756.1 response regulator [Massilia sp. Se16.2.3]
MNKLAVADAALPPRVLVLDDDRFMLEMLKDMLEQLGVREVYTEATTRHALATLAEQNPDLLICDLALPDMDGIEFLQAAAARGFGGAVILLSGMDSGVRDAASELARVLGLRVAGTFRKPIALDQLRTAVTC